MNRKTISSVISKLSAKHGAKHLGRIKTGVNQAARLWRKEDGGPAAFTEFCLAHFYTGETLDRLFTRVEDKLEALSGHFTALYVALRLEIDEDRGPIHPIDPLFAAYSPAKHMSEDLFKNKILFVVLLNFPLHTLELRLAEGKKWSREQWARSRLAQSASNRVPPAVLQAVTDAETQADNYINNYNIYMEKVAGRDGKPMFRKGLRLISHWGLRDELKSMYVEAVANLPKQKTIQRIMERIIDQSIPAEAVNSDKRLWEPESNTLDGKPARPEPDSRYANWLAVFRAHKLMDKYYPDEPSHIDRRFKLNREIPEREVEAIFHNLLSAPEGKKAAALIERRLGRKLLPFDIWYDGFSTRGALSEDKLDSIVRKRYPSPEAFQRDIPHILARLGFDKKTAAFLESRIEVDNGRGAGHAIGAGMRGEKAHLRTRIPETGMNYQGFNTAMHELGHCVEQTFSLYRMDHNLLQGVPNTAFTEGFAFVFQAKDMDVLGLSKPDPKARHIKTLDLFWSTREIAGVALVDMRAWRWLYKNPDASPARFKAAVIKIAKEVWNAYFAPVFGVRDSALLAIYSHLVFSAMYIPDYPLGFIISYQVEDYFKRHPLPKELERMCRIGRVTPAEWMRRAVGAPISVSALISGAKQALSRI